MKPSGSQTDEQRFSNALFCKEVLDADKAVDPKEPPTPKKNHPEIKPAPQPPDQGSSTDKDQLEGPSPARKASAARWDQFRKEHESWCKHREDDKQPGEGWMRKVMHWLNIR